MILSFWNKTNKYFGNNLESETEASSLLDWTQNDSFFLFFILIKLKKKIKNTHEFMF